MMKLDSRLVVEFGCHVGVDKYRPATRGFHDTQKFELVVDVVVQADTENDIKHTVGPDVPCIVMYKMQIGQVCAGPYVFSVGNVPCTNINACGLKSKSGKLRRVATLEAAKIDNRPSLPTLRKEKRQERPHAKVVARLINGRSRRKGAGPIVETDVMRGKTSGMFISHLSEPATQIT